MQYTRAYYIAVSGLSEKNVSFYEEESEILSYNKLCKVPVILVGFQYNLNFLGIFFKCSNITFHKNPSSGSRVVS